MSFNFQFWGHTDTLDDERSVIDRFEEFLSSVGGLVTGHSATTSFHGAGDVTNLINNTATAVQTAPDQPSETAAPATEVPPVTPDPAAVDPSISAPVPDPVPDPNTFGAPQP